MLKDRVEEAVSQAAEKAGYLIYETGILLRGENSHITVKIDSLEGISHDDCQKFSDELSAILDDNDILPNYSLEISSPGMNRKLRDRDDFVRFSGSTVKVNFVQEDGSNRSVTGKLISVEEDELKVEEQGTVYIISMDSITSSNIEL
jgi:ribosome maturation factor RimP